MEIGQVGKSVASTTTVSKRTTAPPVNVTANSAMPQREIVAAVKDLEQGVNAVQVSEAVKSINKSLKDNAQGIEFSVDDDNGQVIVKVIDQNTKELIRQMPSEEALKIAKAMDQAIGLLIKQTA
ncbi:flagellar protein FlaG [Undibacterium fentianense]|uniref:Flagellar protein FlaG n=1 Tax=Undibacterium fentianense TaxID=2828728 RepID=A0A941IBD4_9BURK|nr:flagellar protein FlaG [Undibacterium fentianense]MBR7798934.1 flagellar protein FlaG [Undibacterium fentianense]